MSVGRWAMFACPLLFVVMVTVKLTIYPELPMVVVFAPVAGPVLIGALGFLGYIVLALIIVAIEEAWRHIRGY